MFRRLVAPALLACALSPTVSAQTIYPIDRATILVGATFDFKVEFPGLVKPEEIKVTVNGIDHATALGRAAKFIEREDGQDKSSLWLDAVSIARPGKYSVTASDGKTSRSVTWEVYKTAGKREAKNVILFIGDGMSVGTVTAARMLGRGIEEGKYRDRLTMDTLPRMGLVGTSGVDSIVTDSANSAHAYTTGHKSSVNALGVYASRAKSNLDHPKVETIASLVKRKHGMAVGIVTNTEIEDATPASMVAHTRRRADYDVIVGQLFESGAEVIMGGGSANFLPRSTAGSRRKDDTDYIRKFKDAGYQFATTETEMQAAAGKPDTRKLLGLFHARNMDGALDRKFLKGSTVKQFPEQPDLTGQVKAALDVLSRGPKGFMLMVESGLIDKYQHPLDWERAVYDAIMLDNAVKVALDFAAKRNDTLIIVVPDHTHGISIVGTVDDNKPGEDMREKIGVYAEAGYPNYPAPNAEHYPSTVDVSKRLAIFFNNFPDYYETFRPKLDAMNVPAVMGPDRKAMPNEKQKDVPGALLRTGILPRANDNGVHTADDVVLRATGPGSQRVKSFMDNTEVFRLMAEALALGAQKQR